jgi:hypothetical protein
VSAALKRAHIEPYVIEKARDPTHMVILAMVRSAGQSQFFVSQPQVIDGVRGYHGQGLHRLDRRSWEDRPRNVASRGDDAARCVHDHERAAVTVLNPVSTSDFCEYGISLHQKKSGL